MLPILSLNVFKRDNKYMRQLKLQVNGFNQADENTPYQAFVRRLLIESSCDFAFAHKHKEIRELRNTIVDNVT